jgi:hypothetical protein
MTVYVASITATSDKIGQGTGSATYATTRNSTPATTTPGVTTLTIGQANGLGQYNCNQYFVTFDSTTIPAGQAVQLSLNVVAGTAFPGDTWEVRVASASTNKIAGGSLAATLPLLGTVAIPSAAGRVSISLDTALLPRSSAVILLVNSQREQLNTPPTANQGQGATLTSVAGAAASRPQLVVPGPWAFVGVSAVVEAIATPLTLAEPAGVADGDLLVATIASRTTATTAPSGTGWTAVGSQNNNNILATTSALASGVMLYQVRSGTPTLSFTLPAGISVAMGRIAAYRGNATTTPLDASTAVTTATGTTAVSVAGLTTTQDDDLIVALAAGGQEAAWDAFNNVTTPIGASGATSTAGAPSASGWTERADSLTTTGVDTSLAIFDAVRTGTGATGNLTATASVSAGHVVIAGAFKIKPPAVVAGLIGVWTGAAWVNKPMMVWTGSAWAQKPVMRWNGSAWV